MSGHHYPSISGHDSNIHAGDIINRINSSGPLLLLDPQALAANDENRQQLQQITEHLGDLKLYIQQHLNNALPDASANTERSVTRASRNFSRPFAEAVVKSENLEARSEKMPDEQIEATLQVLDGRLKTTGSIESLRVNDVHQVTFNVYTEVNLRKVLVKKGRRFKTEYQLMHTFSSDREDLIAAKALRIGYYVHKTDLPPFSTTNFNKEDCHPLVRVANFLIGLKAGWIWSSYAKVGYSVPCSSHYYGFLFTRIRYEDLIGVTVDQLDSVKWPIKRTLELSIIPCPGCLCRDESKKDQINRNHRF